MAKEIKATRSELMKVKKQISLAKSGYNLLKKKRDGLMLEFFEIMKKAKSARTDLIVVYKDAMQKMNIARMIEGDMKVKSIALAVHTPPDIQMSVRNIMGIRIPKVDGVKMQEDATVKQSFAIEEAELAYKEVIKKIIIAAEVETTMKKLLHEIQRTIRRVNALEFVVLPRLKHTKSFIQVRLEEMERENVFGMKLIKART